MKSSLKKTWITPFVGFSFFIVAITGLLMLLHIRSHILNSLHEWIGLLFVITGVIHLILNWPVFLSYFSKKQGVAAIFAVILFTLILTFGSLLTPNSYSGKSGYRGGHFYRHR